MVQPSNESDLARGLGLLEGRCISCGFVAKHSAPSVTTRTYFEVELAERVSGSVFAQHIEAYQKSVPTAPICFRGAAALGDEVKAESAADPNVAHTGAAVRILFKDRHCSQWFQYVPGLGPVEHLGGLAVQEAERRQQAFQKQLEQERQVWEARQEHERRAWERAREKERRNFEIVVSGVFAVFAIVQIVVALA